MDQLYDTQEEGEDGLREWLEYMEREETEESEVEAGGEDEEGDDDDDGGAEGGSGQRGKQSKVTGGSDVPVTACPAPEQSVSATVEGGGQPVVGAVGEPVSEPAAAAAAPQPEVEVAACASQAASDLSAACPPQGPPTTQL